MYPYLYCIILSVFLTLQSISSSQTETTVDVFVEDHYTDEPLAEALVSVLYEGEVVDSSYTDSDGRAQVTATPTGVEDADVGIPTTFSVSENYPNPFRNETRVDFDVPEHQTIHAEVYNVLGQRVHSEDFTVDAGYYTLNLSLAHLATGAYFLRLRGAEQKTVKLMKLGGEMFLDGRTLRRGNIQVTNRTGITGKTPQKAVDELEEFTIRVERDRYETWEVTQTIEADTEITVPLERLNKVVFQVEHDDRLDFEKELEVEGVTIEEFSMTVMTPDTVILKSGIYSIWGETDTTVVSEEIEIASVDTMIIFTTAAQDFQTLEPGGIIVGVDSVHFGAPEGAIEEGIEISIEQVIDPTVEIQFPDYLNDINVVSNFYELTASEDIDIAPEHPLILGIPVPEGLSTENLAIGILVPSNTIWLHGEEEPSMRWRTVRGQYDEESGLFGTTVTFTGVEPHTYFLIDGITYANIEIENIGGDNSILENRVHHFHEEFIGFLVSCIGFEDPGQCTSEHRLQTANALNAAYEKYVKQSGFEEPRLRYVLENVSFSILPPSVTQQFKYEYYLENIHPFWSGYSYTTKTASTGFLANEEFPHPNDHITAHEFFHAIQFGYSNTGRNRLEIHLGDDGILEGTATAVEMSVNGLRRSNIDALDSREPKRVDLNLFASDTAASPPWIEKYRVQDFWVFLGKKIDPVNPNLNYLIPLFAKGSLREDIDEILREEGTYKSLGDAYWQWAKNQTFEKSVVLGPDIEGNPVPDGEPCALYHNAVGNLKEISYSLEGGTTIQTDFILPPLKSKLIEITFEPNNRYFASATIEAPETSVDIDFKFYHEKDAGTENCRDAALDNKQITVHGGDEEVRVYALISNTTLSDTLQKIVLTIDKKIFDWITSSPTIADEVVYYGSPDHHLYALDAETGQVLWSFPTDGQVFSSPMVVDDHVFIGSADGNVYAVDAGSGTEVWSVDTGSKIVSSPTVLDGDIYIGSFNGNVYAFDAENGAERWVFETDSLIASSPTVIDDIVFIGSFDNRLYALDADRGIEVWSYETEGAVYSSPTVAGDDVFIGSTDGHLYAINKTSGEVNWKFETGGAIVSSATVFNGTVYVGSLDHHVYALDVMTGVFQWSVETGDMVASSPTLADGAKGLFVGSFDNHLYALVGTTGQELWSVVLPDRVNSSPTQVDGTLYAGSADGSLFALDSTISGSSEDTRVMLGTLGHHHGWTGVTEMQFVALHTMHEESSIGDNTSPDDVFIRFAFPTDRKVIE